MESKGLIVGLRRFNYAINNSTGFRAFHGVNHVPVGASDAERADRALTRRVVDGDLTVAKERFQVPFLVDTVIKTIFETRFVKDKNIPNSFFPL